MKNYLFLFLTILLFTSCPEKESEDKIKSNTWEDLRDLQPGDVKFDGDYFCYYDCYNDKIFCGQREVCGCDESKYHSDFFSLDCYFITDESAGEGYNNGEEFNDEGFFIVCFCGRSGNTYAGDYLLSYQAESCNDIYNKSPRGSDPDWYSYWDGECEYDCGACKKNCVNKECGSDGCGGSCGTCSGGKSCNSSGICVSGGTDPCSACLSTCHGLPGCCTGCYCLCEDECGGCF